RRHARTAGGVRRPPANAARTDPVDPGDRSQPCGARRRRGGDDGLHSADRGPAGGVRGLVMRTSAMPPLRVRTLGGFAVWRGDDMLPEHVWAQPKVVALFTLLLSSPGQRLHREQVAEALWPDADPVQ